MFLQKIRFVFILSLCYTVLGAAEQKAATSPLARLKSLAGKAAGFIKRANPTAAKNMGQALASQKPASEASVAIPQPSTLTPTLPAAQPGVEVTSKPQSEKNPVPKNQPEILAIKIIEQPTEVITGVSRRALATNLINETASAQTPVNAAPVKHLEKLKATPTAKIHVMGASSSNFGLVSNLRTQLLMVKNQKTLPQKLQIKIAEILNTEASAAELEAILIEVQKS